MPLIEVTLIIKVPSTATKKDITDWVDVELCGYNSMKKDNPCRADTEVLDSGWCYSNRDDEYES